MLFAHRHLNPRIAAGHPLAGKTLHVPAMAAGSVELFCATLRWLGVEAQPTPPSNARTLELGAKVTCGDECYPAKITMGDFMRIIEQPGFDPAHAAFFMATSDGPCRFGQYAVYMGKLLREVGHSEVQVFSLNDKDGYAGLGALATSMMRTGWRALVAADLLRKLLLKTRPYELEPGAADRAFRESLDDLSQTIEASCAEPDCQMKSLLEAMLRARGRFRAVPARYDRELPLIGVLGEIFCRLNTFSNEDLIRRLETYGAETWLSDIAEWISYTNAEEKRKLRLVGRGLSKQMLRSRLRQHFQHKDEQALLVPFREDFAGYEEPPMEEILELGRPYLPCDGVCGEMAISAGKATYLARHGADGIIDISPFTCMNGIVSEAIYPKISRDHGGIPIRNFYFDGTQSDLDRDLGIYLELARSYREKKQWPRQYPACFGTASLV